MIRIVVAAAVLTLVGTAYWLRSTPTSSEEPVTPEPVSAKSSSESEVSDVKDIDRRQEFGAKVAKIENGMSRTEVESILGKPEDDKAKTWTYTVWFSTVVLITFDDSGKVAEVRKGGVWPDD